MCALRPTAAVFWLALFAQWLLIASGVRIRTVAVTLLVGAFALGGLLVSDRFFYGDWVPTIWNFFNINIVQGSSSLSRSVQSGPIAAGLTD